MLICLFTNGWLEEGEEGWRRRERERKVYDDPPQHPPDFGTGFLSSVTVGTNFVEVGRTGGVFGSFLAKR